MLPGTLDIAFLPVPSFLKGRVAPLSSRRGPAALFLVFSDHGESAVCARPARKQTMSKESCWDYLHLL